MRFFLLLMPLLLFLGCAPASKEPDLQALGYCQMPKYNLTLRSMDVENPDETASITSKQATLYLKEALKETYCFYIDSLNSSAPTYNLDGIARYGITLKTQESAYSSKVVETVRLDITLNMTSLTNPNTYTVKGGSKIENTTTKVLGMGFDNSGRQERALKALRLAAKSTALKLAQEMSR